ncbi:MAG: ribonuclease III family protein [Promethearchaeota archaeon]
MDYEYLIRDLNQISSRKIIGTDKGLAKIGDGVVNLAYSVAKSIFLTNNSTNKKIVRTGLKVNRTILSNALKNANMKEFAKNRGDAHDLADTVEAIIAYVWLSNKMTLSDIIDILKNNFEGDLHIKSQELNSATQAFTKLLIHAIKYLPEK